MPGIGLTRRRLARRVLGPFLVWLASACVVPTGAPLPDAPVASHRVLGVPFFAQERAQCGPAALAMALSYAGTWTGPSSISDQVFTEGRGGSFAFDVVGAARRRGHVPYPVESWEGLLAEVAADRPVVVMQNLGLAWLPQWHFAVVIGFDLEARTVTLHTGPSRAREMALATFDRTWRRASRWARVILPPDALPVQLPPTRTLGAIAALEPGRQWDAAARAYAAAAERWPDSRAAHFGLGNARYHTGDLLEAERAFRAALKLDPEFMPALNNLAYVLVEKGETGSARRMLRTALQRPGPWQETLERTLERIGRDAPSATAGDPAPTP